MFRPPVYRGLPKLDRAFFRKNIPLTAARVLDIKLLNPTLKTLQKSKDALQHPGIAAVAPDPEPVASSKCILLRPEISLDQASWSRTLTTLIEDNDISLIPYLLRLKYEFWSYSELISAIVPPDGDHTEIPVGYNQAGHIAHLNLRDDFQEYKHIIAQLLIDKIPSIKTVINKVDDVGADNPFRTFKFEILAGPPDFNVEVKSMDCRFLFDYSKVYWNSKLENEHMRIVQMVRKGEVVCDVMAGVGPFAIPLGKKGIECWANDLNPDSHTSLEKNITRNKVVQYVRSFNEDGNTFVPRSIQLLHGEGRHFSHFIMNLPGSAIEFLPAFIGSYAGRPDLTSSFMPMIHVYCFAPKVMDDAEREESLRCKVNKQLGLDVPGARGALTANSTDLGIHHVRDVAPNKSMFCISFRLPMEAASDQG